MLINDLDTFPLLTKKQADYTLFKHIIEFMNRGEHLSISGLLKIINQKASLNRGLIRKILGRMEISYSCNKTFGFTCYNKG